MTTGTKIVQKALQHLSVHSPLQPAPPESLEDAKDTLNAMISNWQDYWNIDMGAVPLDAIGDDLSEPMGARNEIEYCLALAVAPMFPNAQVSPLLPKLAQEGFQRILATWGEVTIPKVIPRDTLPKGQGNKRGGTTRWKYAFFPKGAEIG